MYLQSTLKSRVSFWTSLNGWLLDRLVIAWGGGCHPDGETCNANNTCQMWQCRPTGLIFASDVARSEKRCIRSGKVLDFFKRYYLIVVQSSSERMAEHQ